MGVMFARSYVLQLSDNIKRSKEQAAKRGIWMGLAPTGYIHGVNEKGEKTIIPDLSVPLSFESYLKCMLQATILCKP